METYELQSALLSLTIRLVCLQRSVCTVRYTQETEKLPSEKHGELLSSMDDDAGHTSFRASVH